MRVRLSPVPPSRLTCAVALGCACVCTWSFWTLKAMALAGASGAFAVVIPLVYLLAQARWKALTDAERQEALGRHR
jgi:hypothetical protein